MDKGKQAFAEFREKVLETTSEVLSNRRQDGVHAVAEEPVRGGVDVALEAAELAGMGVEGDPLDVCTPLGFILATIEASFLSLSPPPTFFSSLFLEPLPSISL